ncbi:MAG: hypothetical protein GPOALKHO_000165 [Sodalis sp.]|uniref:hypothetical protein n=1 Tax=Sodalis sp. (in: enterobacteria) TaxID=1898979 RepID=UPI0038734DCC|nr:MAG: hypothetical protein GPOALKHO_000165 [Sodalis sp.]
MPVVKRQAPAPQLAELGHQTLSVLLASRPLIDKTLMEASENVWENLIAEMSNRDILWGLSQPDVDEQA